MKPQPMVSLKSHRYGRKDLQCGERFDAKRSDVKLLMGLGRAQIAEESSEQQESSVINPASQTTEIKAKPQRRATEPRKNSAAQRNRGRYNRRDQRAQD